MKGLHKDDYENKNKTTVKIQITIKVKRIVIK